MFVHHFAVGFTTFVSRPALASEPTPPKNYQNPETIQKWQEEQKRKQQTEFLTTPGIASIREVHVIDPSGKTVLKKTYANHPSDVATSFWRFIMEYQARGSDMPVRPFPHLLGFRVRQFLEIAAIDSLAARSADTDIPMEAWRRITPDSTLHLDPYEALFDYDARKYVDLSACLQLMLGKTTDMSALFQTPHLQAKLAQEIAVRGQLVSAPIGDKE